MDVFVDFFGVFMLVKDLLFDIDYDLYWCVLFWLFDVVLFNGIIKSYLGKGQFIDLSIGYVGQLLCLLSVDVLLCKLCFDFSDIFSEGFYFDLINSMVWIKDGVLYIDDMLVDGFEVDIVMKGLVDLVCCQLDLQVVVVLEIFVIVGVVVVFVVNFIVGVVVFVVSKVLGLLWNKVLILCYCIIGLIDQLQINEVLCQVCSNKK